jgi:hypothetical protein
MVANMLVDIIKIDKIDQSIKKDLINVIKFIRIEETKVQNNVAAVRQAVHADLVDMYNALAAQLNHVQTSCDAIQESTSKVLKETEEAKSVAKETAVKVNKVTDTTDKIASDATSYRDALLAKPQQDNRAKADPKVLNDMERRAKQILIDIFDNEADNIMNKSLVSIVEKANAAVAELSDADKPKGIKVLTALKARKHAVLLTLNSKEAADWLRDPTVEMAFTEKFSPKSHIRERLYNLVVPRVPITFEPKKDEHLRELEETNGLRERSIRKAKWIKPLGRRRADQTHAYVILSLASTDFANILIRDGLYICGTKVRPIKQKIEPIQCMKCRRWGHFASECSSESDVCGSCGENHRTSLCQNKGKTHCVSCGNDTHASWSRDCPEFIRRCQIIDERNPENAMPYFPTEHDWSLTIRPDRVPREDRFPARFAVNTLPVTAGRRSGNATGQTRRGRRRNNEAKGASENPNFIPINHGREEGELPDEEDYWQTYGTGLGDELTLDDWNTPREVEGWD